jgi:23S rRNA (uracil1939-C5)-methyltransferase
MAKKGASIIGWEVSETQVNAAEENAKRNNLSSLTQFRVMNLYEDTPSRVEEFLPLDKMIIDPPRTGAGNLIKMLAKINFTRIVYISCNPKSLAQDAKALIEEQGYQFSAYGLIDMFPQTKHMEAMAVFEKNPKH